MTLPKHRRVKPSASFLTVLRTVIRELDHAIKRLDAQPA